MRKSDWFVLLSRVPLTILRSTFDQIMFYIIPKKVRTFIQTHSVIIKRMFNDMMMTKHANSRPADDLF